jgi:hypothetical protein
MADHFPTFSTVRRFFKQLTSRAAMRASLRALFTERGFLRAALYGLLFLCVVHRTALVIVTGLSPGPFGPVYRGIYGPHTASLDLFGLGFLIIPLMNLIGALVGPAPIDVLIGTLCLAGLAASARTDKTAPPSS